MSKYRSKPKEVEAVQIVGDMILDNCLPPGVTSLSHRIHPSRREVSSFNGEVTTIHGQRTRVTIGDWIITEPDGIHHYPCKPDIFDLTYELITPPSNK